MAYLALTLISLMLISIVMSAIPFVSAQGPAADSGQIVMRTEVVVPNLGSKLDDYCGVTFAFLPDGRMLCGELRSGKVRLIVNNTLTAEPLVDLDVFAGWKIYPTVFDERGLVGLVVDPDFTKNHYVYVAYTYLSDPVTNGTSKRISRFIMANDKLVSETVLVDGIPAAKQHNGGPLKFGSDGKLYSTGGEAGQQKRAQDLGSPLGKILRINPDGSIPSDNPFPGEPYYTIGHRNVFGIAFHPITGRPYITENGNATNDEINLLLPGKNYGWPDVNGTTNDPKYESPIYATGNTTIAPTEAEFYTGDKYPAEFQNNFFFLAYNTRSLDRIELVGPDYDIVKSFTTYQLPLTSPSYTDIEMGPDGYLYVSDFGHIYRVLFERTNIPLTIAVTLPASGEATQAMSISAKVTDDQGSPVPNLPLTFLVSNSTIGSAETGTDGVANIQYTPLYAGQFPVVARFGGNDMFRASASPATQLVVKGSSTVPPQVLEAVTSDNFIVRLTLLPPADLNNNATMQFAINVIDPRSNSELPGIPYHIEIVRDNVVLYSRDEVTKPTLSINEYVFQDSGPAEILVKNINNSENGVSFRINIIPEFPLYIALVPLIGFAIALTAIKVGNMGSRENTL